MPGCDTNADHMNSQARNHCPRALHRAVLREKRSDSCRRRQTGFTVARSTPSTIQMPPAQSARRTALISLSMSDPAAPATLDRASRESHAAHRVLALSTPARRHTAAAPITYLFWSGSAFVSAAFLRVSLPVRHRARRQKISTCASTESILSRTSFWQPFQSPTHNISAARRARCPTSHERD